MCSSIFAQGATNQGKDFWTAYMAHDLPAGEGSNMVVYITSDFDTKGNISLADGSYSYDFNVTRGKLIEIKIPVDAYVKASGKYLKGLHITSQKKIAVFGHIYAQNVSGATLILPVNALGKNYYSINYFQASNKKNTFSTFMVIATEDKTTVDITPGNKLKDGHPAGETFRLLLNKGELYQGLSDQDLTGTTIKSISTTDGECKKIAVYSGSTRIGIGCIGNVDYSSDNLFQQVYPTSSWGKTYLTVPLKGRDYDIFRVVIDDVDTEIKINGQSVDKAEFWSPKFYEFWTSKPSLVTANKPIQVVQYAVTQGRTNTDECEIDKSDIGDPEMIYLTPLEQTLDHVILNSTGNFAIFKHFANVIIKTTAKGSFRVDGKPYTDFTLLDADKTYSYAQVPLTSGVHTMSADGGFNAIAYGFGQHESYGYAAGANLANLNQNIVFKDPGTGTLHLNGCSSINYKLQLTLPYQTNSIKWRLDNGSDPVTINNPVITSTSERDGLTLYTYEYPTLINYTAGDYSVTATVLNPVADECGSTTDVDFDFSVTDVPKTKIAYNGACEGDSTYFIDSTDVSSALIKSRVWDFGDGTTSTLANPVHKYQSNGKYTVVLTVTNANECTSSTQTDVVIAKKPMASFTVDAPVCTKKSTIFTDKSVASDAPITTWIWNMGDSTMITRYDNKPFTHVFKKTGADTVSLTVLTQSGCSSETFSQIIQILPAPDVKFRTPDVCLSDAFAQFSNETTTEDGTTDALTYSWNFGDSKAGVGNPNTSTEKNPKHKYTSIGEYLVTLTATSSNGCQYSVSQSFKVNGDKPLAGFELENKNALCSSNPVVFKDASSVNFGDITRIVWYYDYKNNPQDKEEFTRGEMPKSRKYMHAYSVFSSPASKVYSVHMEAYSGQTCFAIADQDIEVLASPNVNILQVGTICQNAKPIQLVVQQTSLPGTGTFSGKGVSQSGVFDPAIAGVGTTTIKYRFISTNGCDFNATQDIVVLQSPVVNAGDDVMVLEGGSVLLKATAAGKNLIYKWSPSFGLDNDSSLNPMVTATEDKVYTLTATSSDGCSTEDQVKVTVLKNLNISNTFTPNGDGINDTWKIKYLETYPGNTVNVYNRYGEKVYSSVGYGIPWDGTRNGTNLPAGTYYYIIDPKNGRGLISGNVTIIR
ncbi:PKD domain-containing protein [Mucilaginibacter terrenus]|uniref:PKD domain-containing protein n=1 Tax=Mucilaginibacter terrenus TaxID=2482727 RepID=A0A3E2NTH5_9SPHI|nr:PKD domain-containing protein [Mucilaginibacter terrenus]RFZ84308.1 PKD domain-containing protein [Mucilaginibacter terrenus]